MILYNRWYYVLPILNYSHDPMMFRVSTRCVHLQLSLSTKQSCVGGFVGLPIWKLHDVPLLVLRSDAAGPLNKLSVFNVVVLFF
jgi:hypothetical protein